MRTQETRPHSLAAMRLALAAAPLFAAISLLALAGSPAAERSEERVPIPNLPSVMLTLVTGSVSSPVHVANAGDGSGRLFIVEQAGRIRIFKNNQLLSTPFLDIRTIVTSGGEQGLLSVAFHPNYTSNGFFYVYYTDTIGNPGDITLARYQVSANPDVADPASAQILLVVPHPVNNNHNGGQLAFGPNDGYLYMGTGDGGGGGDVPNNAQNLNVLLGKMLRLDVDGTGTIPCGQTNPKPYAIPASNPFVGVAGCDEIWGYGLRNPWRFGFDRVTFDLFIGDVGQNLYEEIDFQPAASAGGENYGWRLMEGLHCYNPPTNCNDGTLTLPILEHDHGGGRCSITGGFRYRGSAIPLLVGTYVYGDFCSGEIFGATPGAPWTTQLLIDTSLNISSFGEDEAGELYVADLNGSVYVIAGVTNPVPTTTSISPPAVIAGDPAFTLTVNGTAFVDGSVVRWNGADRPTTFVSSAKLTADISAGDISTVGTASVRVFTAAPGGGLSNAQTLNINQTFLDVAVSDFASQYIQAIYDAGVTAGCGSRNYCPNLATKRSEMAVFLLKADQGSIYVPPACTPPPGQVFGDVPCPSQYADWIEDLVTRGVTAGCGNGNYCPDASVSRETMAVLLLKTSQGSTYAPPACTPPPGQVFSDVPCPSQYADWIEDLFRRGIAAGCGGGKFCPGDPVTRAQMAVFLTLTFNLTLP